MLLPLVLLLLLLLRWLGCWGMLRRGRGGGVWIRLSRRRSRVLCHQIWSGRVFNEDRGALCLQIDDRLGSWNWRWSHYAGWRGHVSLRRVRLSSRSGRGELMEECVWGVGIMSLHKEG